jgi:opacity protein-like surface antigen
MGLRGPAHPDVSAMAWNPAALGPLAGTHVLVQGAATLDSGVFDRADLDRFPDRSDDEPREFSSAGADAWSGDWFFALAHDFESDRVTVGIGAFTPFVEQSSPGDWPGAYHRRELTWIHLHVPAAALALRVSGDVYVGFGVAVVRSWLHTSLDRDLFLEDPQLRPLGYEEPGARQRLDVQTNGWGFTGGVGVFYRPKRNLDVGVGWLFRQSVRTEGSAQVVDYDGGFAGRAAVEYQLPDTVHAGLEWRPRQRLATSLTLRYLSTRLHDAVVFRPSGYEFSRRPRSPDEAVIPESIVFDRGFGDVWKLDGAVSVSPLSALDLGVGAAAENAVVEERRVNPSQVDGPKASGRVFAVLRPAPWCSIGASWELTVMRDRDVDDSAYDPDAALRCVDSGYDVGECEEFSQGRALPDPSGRYERLTQRFLVGATLDRW